MSLTTDIVALLRRLREAAGLRQEDVGEVARSSWSTVSKWELGETTPPLDKLVLYATSLGYRFEVRLVPEVGPSQASVADATDSQPPYLDEVRRIMQANPGREMTVLRAARLAVQLAAAEELGARSDDDAA